MEEQSTAAGASKIREQNLQIKRSAFGKDRPTSTRANQDKGVVKSIKSTKSRNPLTIAH